METLWAAVIALTLIIISWIWLQPCGLNHIPGPRPWPIIGNAYELLGGYDEILNMFYKKWRGKYGEMYRVYLGSRPTVVISSPEIFEPILSSQTLLDKGMMNDLERPWIGDSILISTGSKWKSRRRLLTPAFHFKILDTFMDTFNEQSLVLCEKIQNTCTEGNQGEIDVHPLMNLCAMDIICETSMGVKINAQQEESEYSLALHRISQIVVERFMKPWLRFDWLFSRTALGREQQHCLKTLHGFAEEVIRKRRESRLINEIKVLDDDSTMGIKTRWAFLDSLLAAADSGAPLTDRDIREEVDVFMFAGHDTASTTVSWFLYCMAIYPKFQAKVAEEIDQVFGQTDRFCTREDSNELKYLECCIKETLRIYPSGPFIIRCTTETTTIGGHEIPPGCDLMMSIIGTHRNPRIYPDPEIFRPERFTPEESVGRHPFAFIPFSAGPRNCIGQKFAMLELKVILTHLIRRFQFQLLPGVEEPKPSFQLILKPFTAIRLLVSPRCVTHSG